MKRQYKAIKMGDDRQAIVAAANRLVANYQAQGYSLTVRQIYYQFVAQDLFPASWANAETGTKNTQQNYKRLADILGDARMSGRMDWSAIEDRTREIAAVPHWASPAEIIASAQRSFRLDKWVDQLHRVECWIEKDALEGIANQAAHALDVTVFSCRGYGSLSSLWAAGRRLLEYIKARQRPVILHLGDFDPSGLDMTRDIDDRLNDFITTDWLYEQMVPEGISEATVGEIYKHIELHQGGGQVLMPPDRPLVVRRIALTREQVTEYEPPPNPAKTTDARYKKFQAEHGDESWELDALDPAVLDDLITTSIRQYVNGEKYDAQVDQEEAHRAKLGLAAQHWDGKVSAFLGTLEAKENGGKNKKAKGARKKKKE